MSTWLVVLIGLGVTVVVVGLSYVVWRWGGQRSAITTTALTVTTFVLGFLKTFLKDDPKEMDAYDWAEAGEVLSSRLAAILKLHSSGVSFLETKAEMVAAVREIAEKFPSLEGKLTDEIIDKEVEAALLLISNIPKVKDIIKK